MTFWTLEPSCLSSTCIFKQNQLLHTFKFIMSAHLCVLIITISTTMSSLAHWTMLVTSSSSCVWNHKNKRNRSLGTCWEATHELLHQHQSSHGDHLVDDRGGTRCWCDLLSANPLRSCRLDSWLDRPHLHISALKRPTPVHSWWHNWVWRHQ